MLSGVVTALKDFGAFVDVGGIEGLLPASEIGFQRGTKPSDVLSVGQPVTVQVMRVEKRDDPSLKDKPVIVGGARRGVVSAACYIARTFGVRSAMPMFKALALCPSATVIRPDMAKYVRVGREVRHAMHALTPLVEPLSIDEAFLDLTGTQALHHAWPAASLAALARAVENEVGVTVSIGLSYNKFLAKVASDLDKPRGFAVIGEAEAPAFLAGKPVGLIWGVGKALAARAPEDRVNAQPDHVGFYEGVEF